jgi:hypothetical protein
VWVDHSQKRVHFGPDSGLQIEPLNRGIGRFLAAQGINWAKKRWPAYTVDGMDLNNKDALNEDTRLRRDHFLRVHGFDVVYADAQHLKGSVKEVQVGDLLGDWNGEAADRRNSRGGADAAAGRAEPGRAGSQSSRSTKRRSASTSVKTPACASPSPAWWRLRCFRRGC